MDNVKGLDHDIDLMSVSPVNLLIGPKNTAIVATFESDLEPNQINDVLNIGGNRSFFIFELNAKSCAVHIDNPALQTLLFSEFKQQTSDEVVFDGDEIPSEYDEDELSSLDKDERTKLMDKLLDLKSLTNNQKKVLSFLASL